MARLLKNTSRTRKVRPYPLHPIQDCLEIATAIFSNNSGLPIDRNILASQLNSTPSSSGFITKLNSSFKYGLTKSSIRFYRKYISQSKSDKEKITKCYVPEIQ